VHPNLSITSTASMKSYICRIAVAAAALLCQGAPARAAVFNWDVSFSLSGGASDPLSPATVTGSMVTDCDSCILKASDITSFSFSWTYLNGVTGAASGTTANVGFGDNALTASGGLLSYTGGAAITETFTDGTLGTSQVAFGLTGAGTIRLQNIDLIDLSGSVTQPFTIGTEQVSAVPEPSTWAMMILGFCGLGFMAYRKKMAPEKQNAEAAA
jgi:hypothetical protein